ncbi:MAG: alpha/beta hydrolase [Lachnospiraceae bacterium]|nr:alpha/beta hydrolase [Lachnospiraceae bacterium]
MNFLCFGNKDNKSILFIHGMASTAMLCYEPILGQLSDYYVILAEVDGHSERTDELVSLGKNCEEIENYIINNLSGNVYCLSGFSMGATMAVEIIGRGNVNVAKTHLDAAFLVKMGLLTKPYEYIFCKAIKRIQKGKKIPKFMMDAVMGKDNNSIIEMLYPDITSGTIKNACEFVYKYSISEKLKSYKGTVLFWRGSEEQYPRKSAALLKKYLPDLIEVEIENMGHGQYLHEHSDEYVRKLIEYLQN